jgi:ribose transport system substrate-binding protein
MSQDRPRSPKPRRTSVLLAGALLAFVLAIALAACGGGSSSSSSESSGSSEPASSSSESSSDGSSTPAAEETAGSPATASTTENPPSLEGKKIAYIETGPIPYYEYTKESIEKAGEMLGAEVKVYNSNFESQKELANVEAAITEQVDGLVIEPYSAALGKASLRLTDRAEIPTVALYAYSPEIEEEAVQFQQANYPESGCLVGEAMKELVPSGEVAIITGTPGRGEVEAFSKAFRECVGNKVEVVAEVNGNWDRQTSASAAQDLITKYPNLKGIFVQNEDMALGVIPALGSKASQITIISQNGSPEGEKAVEEGKIQASVGWSPSAEGAMTVRALAESLSGVEVAPKLCLTPFAVDTPEEPHKSMPWEVTTQNIETAFKTPCAESKTK